ncbi:hypothetical protein HX005_06725 [Acinetobacter sp. R933-2]|uniref:hypothetical protein n=1 Tax=Acinetobacter sp. R933-2 TaxID=2746728 RepID=UPI0025757F33|nr:hypothetical protein [Acinetobacter sp. R933-2]MDM1247076.1 hypothetical protein [Acinetobacter sp. R933-2]
MNLILQTAIQAPVEIPAWFDAENGCFEFSYPEFSLEKPVEPRDLSAVEWKILQDWLADPSFDLPESLEKIGNQWVEYWDADRDHKAAKRVAYAQARYFEWRKFYALNMLKITSSDQFTVVYL